MSHVATVTIDNTKVAGDLTDFPVYVDLSDMNATFWSTVANGGGDIRVFKSDGTTELPREVVSCDTGTETGELHFKYTGTLSSSTDTEVQIHADGTSSDYATTDTYGAEAVWSDYRLVMHLNGNVLDSSGNLAPENNGGVFTAGVMGGAVLGNGSSAYVDTKYIPDTDNEDLTLSIWGYLDTSNFGALASVEGSSTTYGFLKIRYFDDGGTETLAFEQRGGSGNRIEVTSLTTDAWNQIHYVLDHDSTPYGRAYVNGVDGGTQGSEGIDNMIRSMYLLANNDSSGIDTYWNSKVSEFRVRIGKLTADWITTEHNNQNSPSTFYTVSEVSGDTIKNNLFTFGGM